MNSYNPAFIDPDPGATSSVEGGAMQAIESVLGTAIGLLLLLVAMLGLLGIIGLEMRWLCRIWSKTPERDQGL
jgi:hypothetical protein